MPVHCLVLSLGGSNEKARFHIANCRRDSMAARSARATAGDAGGRISHSATLEANAHNVAAFRQGLAEAGYVEGKNVTIEFHFANFRPELMSEAAGDLIRRNVSVIFAAEPAAVAGSGAQRPAFPSWR